MPPLQVFLDLPSYIPTTQCIFSPSEKFIMTGTGAIAGGAQQSSASQGGDCGEWLQCGSAAVLTDDIKLPQCQPCHVVGDLRGPPGCRKNEDGTGYLYIWDAKTFKLVRQLGLVPDGSVTSMLWSEHTNQIAVGGSDGTRVLYSPKTSKKG